MTGGTVAILNKIHGGPRLIQSIVWTERGIELGPVDSPNQITGRRTEDKAIYTEVDDPDRETVAEAVIDYLMGGTVSFYD